MKKKLSILLILVLVLGMIIANFATATAKPADNSVQIALQKEVDFYQSNTLLDDKAKLQKIAELYFFMKKEDYKSASDFDYKSLMLEDPKYSKNQKFIKDKMKLNKELKKKLNYTLLWDNLAVKINDVKISDDSAIVEALEDYRYIIDNYDAGISSTGYTYTLHFQKYDNKWLITEITSDDPFDKEYTNSDLDVNKKINEVTSVVQIHRLQ